MTSRFRTNAKHYKYGDVDEFFAKSKQQMEKNVRTIKELEKLQKERLSRTKRP